MKNYLPVVSLAGHMVGFPDQCREHLNRALEEDDVTEKNYYIRQMLQLCDIAEMSADTEEQSESPRQSV